MLLWSHKYLKYFLSAITFSTINPQGDEENFTMFVYLNKFSSSVDQQFWFKNIQKFLSEALMIEGLDCS